MLCPGVVEEHGKCWEETPFDWENWGIFVEETGFKEFRALVGQGPEALLHSCMEALTQQPAVL